MEPRQTFVLLIIMMALGASIVIALITAKNQAKTQDTSGSPDATRAIELLSAESGRLQGKVGRLEERIAVLERIATDRPAMLAAEIDNLR